MANLEKASTDAVQINYVVGQANLELSDPILSNEARELLEIIIWVGLNGPFSVLGSALNVVNIIVFAKEGFNDPVNISLCGLAVSDLGSVVTLVWGSIAYNPLFRYSNIGFDSVNVQYISSGWPHGFFVRVTCWITAFITFERCICIVYPMKVKTIVTPKRTVLIIFVIFVTMLASVLPVFSSRHLEQSFDAQQNRSLYILNYNLNGLVLEESSFTLSVIWQISSFIVVVVCTVTLIHELRIHSIWRYQATTPSLTGKSDSVSTRDKRVMKMVTFISGIFIACYFPSVVSITMMACLQTVYSNDGFYKNLYHISWAIINMLEAINSSVSILVYYNMSTKFRKRYKELFKKKTNPLHK